MPRTCIKRCALNILCAIILNQQPSLAHADNQDLDIKELKAEVRQLTEQVRDLKEKATIARPQDKNLDLETEAKKSERIVERVKEEIFQAIQPTTTVSPAQSASAFNPAMSFAIDQVLSETKKNDANYEFRSGELGIAANIDPFAKGYAFINATSDEIELEEASIVTTSLPYNLSIQAGRFFANLNRLAKLHGHDLPTVNAPLVNEALIGGEAQADGLEVSYLLPTEHFFNLTFGAYNKIGAENERIANDTSRKPSEFTYLGRAETSVNLDGDNTLDLGGTLAYTPAIKGANGKARSLYDIELTYRFQPLSSTAYQGFIWSTEFMYNDEYRPLGGVSETEATEEPRQFKRQGASGLYSYVELKLSKRWVPGFLFDFVQDIDRSADDSFGYSPYLSCYLSEFQRLRAQYSHLELSDGNSDEQVFLQWTIFLGNHVHGFKNR